MTWYDVLGALPGAEARKIKQKYEAKASLLRPELISAGRIRLAPPPLPPGTIPRADVAAVIAAPAGLPGDAGPDS